MDFNDTQWWTNAYMDWMNDTDLNPANGTEPPGNETEQLCRGTIYIERIFINIAILPACVIMILISFLQQRKRLWPNCCDKRPAVAFPVNLVDEHQKRWAYAAAFGILSYKILLLFDGDYFFAPATFSNPAWMKKYGFVKVFIQLINVVQVGLVYYPLFACTVYRKLIAANIFGFIYSGIWLAISLLSVLACMETNDHIQSFLGQEQIVINIVFYIPVAICYVILLGAFVFDFVMNVRRRCKPKKGADDEEKDTLSEVYVKSLFKRESRRKPKKVVEKVKHHITYENVPGLKYSPRVLCTMVVATFALMKVAIELGYWLDTLLRILLAYLEVYGEQAIELVDDAQASLIYDRIVEGIRVTRVVMGVCNGFSALLHIVFMILMVLAYRQHIRKYILGDREWHYKCNISPTSCVVGSMRYAGYQIAFVLYGWFIMFAVLFIVVMVLTFLFVLPLRDGYSTILIDKLRSLWPTFLISLAILLIQKLLATFVFLQDRGKYMALNNTRWYHVMGFFLFFFNVLLGLFSALKRILISMVAGVIFLCRLDRVLMMRGVERFDSGFNSYLGMLKLEVYHTHPILRYFVQCLNESMHTTQKDLSMATDDEDREVRRRRHRRRVLANKWFKAITLINNPQILVERLNRLIEQQKTADGAITQNQLEEALKQAYHVLDKSLIDERFHPDGMEQGQDKPSKVEDVANTHDVIAVEVNFSDNKANKFKIDNGDESCSRL